MRVTFRPHYAGKNGCYRSLWFSLNMKASRPGQPSAYLMTETGEGEEGQEEREREGESTASCCVVRPIELDYKSMEWAGGE